MNKVYLILFFIFSALIATAQEAKTEDKAFAAETQQAKVMKFYPNPATSVINFEFIRATQGELTLQVYNFVGKKVYESNSITQKTSIPLTEFYRGVYIFQLRDKTGRIVESGKFQVVK